MTGNNPEPRTEAGTRLLNDVREVVVHGVTDRIRPGFDLAWHVARGIAAIEAEATAAAEQRLRERIEALVSVRFGGGPALLHRAEVLGLLEPQAALASDPASPSEPAIPLHQGAAAPRQGEPVDVERFIEAVRRSALLGRREPTVMLRMWVRYAEVIQRHYAALSEPAEAGKPG